MEKEYGIDMIHDAQSMIKAHQTPTLNINSIPHSSLGHRCEFFRQLSGIGFGVS